MLYAHEVIDLLAAFPGREWRMAEIVNYVARGRPQCKQQRERYRKGVRRVLEALIEAKCVQYKPARSGGTTLYRWKAGHEAAPKQDALRDNSAGKIAFAASVSPATAGRSG